MTEATPARRPLRWFLPAIPLAIFLILCGFFLKQLLFGTDARDIPSALIGKKAPQFQLAAIEGLAAPGLSSADLAGKVTVVNVWASWCVPCRTEHPLLTELAKDARIQLAGINYKDQPENALRFLGQLGNPFARIGSDPRGSAAIDWGVYGVPETFIVGADGTILHKHVGPLTPENFTAKFRPALERIIAKSGGKG